MRTHRFVLAAILAAGGATAALPAPQQVPTFRAGTKVVALYGTVTDQQGRLVPNLVKEDFEVFDNDKPQEISFFDNEIQAVSVVVMLDTSFSMTRSLDLLRRAAEQFLIRLLPADKGRVGAFNDKIQFSSKFTSNRDDLVGYLQDLDFGNPTRLYDAIGASMDELKPLEGRRVVLIFTDGDDTASRIGLGTVIDRARADEMMIYAIGLQSEYGVGGGRVAHTKPDRGLRKLAEETGGGYFELEKTTELAPTFTRVAQELHSQYVIGFTPTQLDGKVHKLALKVKQPGMTARARKSYVAATEKG